MNSQISAANDSFSFVFSIRFVIAIAIAIGWIGLPES